MNPAYRLLLPILSFATALVCATAAPSKAFDLDGVPVAIITNDTWSPSEQDVRASILATREYLRTTVRESTFQNVSKLTLMLVEQHWTHYCCRAAPILKEGQRVLDLYFVLGSARSEEPEFVIRLADSGAIQWKCSYDVDAQTVRSVEANYLVFTDINEKSSGTMERISVDFPDDRAGRIIKNIADVYGLEASIPEELFEVTKSLKLHDVSWPEIIDAAIEDTGYEKMVKGKVISFRKINLKGKNK